MAYKQKRSMIAGTDPVKKAKHKAKEEAAHRKFLDEQREEKVHAMDYLTKTPVGPRAEEKKGGAPKRQDKQTVVPASEHEKSKNTAIAKETDSKAEKINDLEDRIEFLESDIADAGQEGPTKQRAQLMKLKAQLAKLRGN